MIPRDFINCEMEQNRLTRSQKSCERIPKMEHHSEQRHSQTKNSSKYVHNPAPIFRKSKKRFVADSDKDQKYWDHRKKNNLAAKRSRDRRRKQEIEVASKWKELQQENAMLKEQLLKLKVRQAEVEKKLKNF